MVYRHYGSTAFSKYRFQPVRNLNGNKPRGGLWASPIDAPFGWREWNEGEHFSICREELSFCFTLTPDARVLHIRTVADVRNLLPRQKDADPAYIDYFPVIDFEALLVAGWDAIEYHMSEDNGLYWALYGWDCDSICVLNPDVVCQTEAGAL